LAFNKAWRSCLLKSINYISLVTNNKKEKNKKKEKFTYPRVFCFSLRVLDGTLLPLCQVFYSKIKNKKRKEINKQEIVWRRAAPVF